VLPETFRPTIGSEAAASVHGSDGRRFPAHLRQLSDAADGQTRTYEPRYVLEGDNAAAPLGATVTIRFVGGGAQSDVSVPIGALIDDGNRTGVWTIDEASSTVRFVPVTIKRIGEETAVVSGIGIGKPIVAPRSDACHHRAVGYQRDEPAARSFAAGHGGAPAAHCVASGRVPHRDGRKHRRVRQGQCCAWQDISGHDRRRADRHRPSGP
jgi:hypothetical protein